MDQEIDFQPLDFQPEAQDGPSLRGFYKNVVNDASGVIGSLDPRNWPDMLRAKQSADQDLADQAQQPETAYELPGDRLAAQIHGIPGVLYQYPVQAAMAAAPFAKSTGAAVAERAPGMARAAAPLAKSAVGAAVNAKTGGAFSVAREVYDFLKPKAAEPTAAKPATPSDALRQELMARISAEPDWRTTDAVPINAMQSKGIIEPGESRIGLGERAAQAQKLKDAAEVDRLLTALRQRMNISAKSGRR